MNKDIYLMLTTYLDDKSVVNMLSVNKKFNDPQFFKQLFSQRYPQLIKFKTEEEDWKQFYLYMVKYIAKLWEDFHYNYVTDAHYEITKSEDPRKIYMELADNMTKNQMPTNISDKIKRLDTDQYRRYILDVSYIKENGQGIKGISVPGARSLKKGVKGYPIYSDNFKAIKTTAKLLGDYRILSLWTGLDELSRKKEIETAARISDAIKKNLPLSEEDQQALIAHIESGNEEI